MSLTITSKGIQSGVACSELHSARPVTLAHEAVEGQKQLSRLALHLQCHNSLSQVSRGSRLSVSLPGKQEQLNVFVIIYTSVGNCNMQVPWDHSLALQTLHQEGLLDDTVQSVLR